MKNALYVLGLLLIVGLLSCQKDIDSTGNEPDPIPSGGKLLTKYIYMVDGGAIYIDSFVYDAQNRCIKVLEKYRDTSYTTPYNDFYDFHYRGNETQPYRITDSSQGRQMEWLLEYDAQHRKILDSMNYLTGRQVSRFTYSSNMIAVLTTSSWSSNPTSSTTHDTFYLAGDNFSRYSGVTKDAGDPVNYWWQRLHTYDNKVNPFNKMNIAAAFWFGSWSAVSDITGINKNNITAVTGSTWNTPLFSTSTQYVYDADNYPVSSQGQTPNDPSAWWKEKFEYKK